MKNSKKRKNNSPVLEGSFSKKHSGSKNHKADGLAHENRLPVDWYEVKIILDATVVEKYLNNRNSGSKISPPQQEKNNVMVKLEIPEDVQVDDLLWPEESLDFSEVFVKQEDQISVPNSSENDTIYDKELQSCYQEVTIGQEFKQEGSIPNGEEIIKKSTRSNRKRKKCLDFDCCNHGLTKKARVAPSHYKIVASKLHIKKPQTCSGKSKTPPKTCKPKPNQKSSIKPQSRTPENPILHCVHCNYKGRKTKLINHFRKKHPHLMPNDSIRCPNCDTKFTSWEEMQSHRPRCLLSLICKLCLVDVPSKRAMELHMQSLHPKEICVEDDAKILDELSRYSLTGDIEEMGLTPFEQRYLEIRRYLAMESELIKLYCPGCNATRDKIMNRIAPCCDSCQSRMLFQCQKCKDTRQSYCYIWKHLTNKNSYCSIFGNLPWSNEEEPTSATDQGKPNGYNRYDCGICDFKGATKTQLCNHIVSAHLNNVRKKDDRLFCSKCGASFRAENVMRLKRHEEFCGVIAIRFPCTFCPTTCDSTRKLSAHIAVMHLDELDGRYISEFLEEALSFKKMLKEVNLERFDDKLMNGEAATTRDCYYKGIESILKPVCIECKTDGPYDGERCTKCQAILNFVCLECDELFSKYSVAWVHATRLCENRKFTLTSEETCKYPATVNSSTTSKELLYCDHCSFKNASKSVLRNHVEQTHLKSYEIKGLFTCSRCYQNFDNPGYLHLHRQHCRMDFEYSCPFCDKTSKKFQVMENHITLNHEYYIPCKDTLDEILQVVIEKKRPLPPKTSNRFDESGQMIRRKFSENVKLTTFYCPKCKEEVHKNFKSQADTRTCPKCNDELSMQCKMCSRSYSTWQMMRNHYQMTKCGGGFEASDKDHSHSAVA